MLAVLELEAIGDNYFVYKKAKLPYAVPSCERYIEFLGLDKSPAWVARLTGPDPLYGFIREFLRGQKDYSRANGTGSRGVYVYYPLRPGIYEVHKRLNWRKTRRYFIRVEGTEITEISREEVLACLTNTA